MKYNENLARTKELLRLVIAQMGKHDAAYHPVNYSVWYEYMAGINDALNREVNELTADNKKLDEKIVHRLFDKHVSDMTEAKARRIEGDLNRVLGVVGSSANEAYRHVDHYGTSLTAIDKELAQAPMSQETLHLQVGEVLRETRGMQDVLSALRGHLTATRGEVEQLRDELNRVREEVLIDALTGLVNRRGFDDRIQHFAASGNGLCLVLIDIDHFKRVNDTYGHVFGDSVLRAIASTLKISVKGRDVVARYGGEEFAVLLPETGIDAGRIVAEQLRDRVARSRIRRTKAEAVIDSITISAGVAEHRQSETIVELVERADAALYASKEGGRNKVTVAA